MKRHLAYAASILVLAGAAMLAPINYVSPAKAGQGQTTQACEDCKAAAQGRLSACDAEARSDDKRSTTRGKCVKQFEAEVRECPCPPGHNNPNSTPR
ncbi:MAG TPA: hypothetical protein VEY11_05435 [Pyrinomonadaceae bacterium]|nr:hypothetical protein [Pyrinomonadaceae bacterium]